MNKFFCIIFIILFISKTENVFSNNLIYDVNNIEVEGQRNNSFNNNKLIEIAFKKAFVTFADKTLLRKDAESLYRTKIATIKDLVLGYQIGKNNNSENFSTFHVKFDSKKINNFLAKRGISYADISNISLTVLPVLVKDKDILLYKENFFYENWIEQETIKKNTNSNLINYNLALENIEDLKYISSVKKDIDLIDVKKINSFNEASNYVLLIVYSGKNEFKAFIKTSINNKDISKNINLKFYPGNEKKSYKEAIGIVKKEINQIWKKQNLIDVNTPSFLDFFLEKRKINDYSKLKTILDKIYIIESYSVLEMTNQYSKIRIKYRGKVSKIKDKFIEKKINVQIIDNVWKLKLDK